LGISVGDIHFLIHVFTSAPALGKLVTLGRQTIHVSGKEVKQIAKARGLLNHRLATLPDGCLNDLQLFQAFGFDTVDSIDCSKRDGATILHDLAIPLPQELRGRFQCVLDIGTMEHVSDCIQCLKNACELTAISGTLIQIVPATNNMDHGYFAFSPSFISDFFSANKWQVVEQMICTYRWGEWHRNYSFFRYDPDLFAQAQWTGRFDIGVIVAAAVVKCADSSTELVGMVQRAYRAPDHRVVAGANPTFHENLRNWGKRHFTGRGVFVDFLVSFWHRYAAWRVLRRSRIDI